MVHARDAQPVRIAWRDRDQAQELPLNSLHRLLATDPAKGLAILRDLRDWVHGRVCSEVWVASKQYTAREWAGMGQVGYTGAEDGGVWAGMVGGDWEREEEVRKVVEDKSPQGQSTTPQTPRHQNWWQENPQNAF